MKRKGEQRGQKPAEKHVPIFYENQALTEAPEINRRTKRPKPNHKHDQLNKNSNYRTKWHDEE